MIHFHYMEQNHQSVLVKKSVKLLEWAVGIALVIVVNLFFYYVVTLVYPQPTINQFCPAVPAVYNDAASCVHGGGQWTNYQMTPTEITQAVKTGQSIGSCDANFTCNQNFDQAKSVYNRNAFIIFMVLALVVLAIGMFIPVEVLSAGLSWAGVLALLIATIRYWSDANNVLRVIVLVVVLAALIWLSFKKFNHKS